MRDHLIDLGNLRRPRILVRAARYGLASYRRDRDLRALVAGADPHLPGIGRLIEMEESLDVNRRSGDRTYSPLTHIMVLTALIAEAALCQLCEG
jgi:hypothetical protein